MNLLGSTLMTHSLPRALAFLAGALLFATGALAAGDQRFDDTPSGISLSYSGDWRALTHEELAESARASGDVSEADIKTMLDNISLSLYREFPSGENVSLVVMAMPMDAAGCAEVDGKAWEDKDAKDYVESEHGALVEHAAKVVGLRGYTAEFQDNGKTTLQHRYWFCSGTHGVLLQTTSSAPESEAAALAILATVKIARH
jgi:hypothetical protein